MGIPEHCAKSEDGTHDYGWWDGDACAWCGAAEMTEEQRVEQGMVEGPPRQPRGAVDPCREALESIEARCARIAAGEFGGLEAAKDMAAEARRALDHPRGAVDAPEVARLRHALCIAAADLDDAGFPNSAREAREAARRDPLASRKDDT